MTTDTATMRGCIGSTRFGIEPHEAPGDEFPVQPSAKDGLGRMCHSHWRQYTNALRKAAVARKAEAAGTVEVAMDDARLSAGPVKWPGGGGASASRGTAWRCWPATGTLIPRRLSEPGRAAGGAGWTRRRRVR